MATKTGIERAMDAAREAWRLTTEEEALLELRAVRAEIAELNVTLRELIELLADCDPRAD